MQSKERLCWTVTGGVLLGIIIGLCISPLTAQDGNFGNITCTSLRVVDANGTQMVLVSNTKYGGFVAVAKKDGKVGILLDTTEHGGAVSVQGKNGEVGAFIDTDKHGGVVSVQNKDGKPAIRLNVDDINEGHVAVVNDRGSPVAELGSGHLALMTDDGRYRMVSMSANKFGGRLSIKGERGGLGIGLSVENIGGLGTFYNNDEQTIAVSLGAGDYGGAVRVAAKDGKTRCALVGREDSGRIWTEDRLGYQRILD